MLRRQPLTLATRMKVRTGCGIARSITRRLTTTASSSTSQVSTVSHVLGGTIFFCACEQGMAHALDAFDIQLPASVSALIALGVVSTTSLGEPLQRALGPSAAWLRAALPWLTVPAYMCAAVVALPEREALPRLAALSAGAVLLTCASTGHLASAFLGSSMPAVPPACATATAAAIAAFSSPRVGVVVLGLGLAGSAAALHICPPATPMGVIKGPAYMGATLATYIAAARMLPERVRRVLPPNVGCAAVLLPAMLAVGGQEEVREYLHGAGSLLLWAVQPAMVTLGLYAFTHRSIVVDQWRALVAIAIASPTLLFVIAGAGRVLGLEPTHIASVLPASTTTGLALTMPSGLKLIQPEWVAAGTAFNSAAVQTLLPLLLTITFLGAKPPFLRGAAVGSTAHVGGMAALVAAGEHAAADAAAVALVVCGVVRATLMQTPAFSRALAQACGEPKLQDVCDSDPATMQISGVSRGSRQRPTSH